MKYQPKRWVIILFLYISAATGLFLLFQLYSVQSYSLDPALSNRHNSDLKGFESDNAFFLQETVGHCFNKNDFARCVNAVVIENHKYVPTKGAVPFRNMFEVGADCEGWSKFYYEALKLDGWFVRYVTVPRHVFVVGMKDNIYCTFDQGVMRCNELDTTIL